MSEKTTKKTYLFSKRDIARMKKIKREGEFVRDVHAVRHALKQTAEM